MTTGPCNAGPAFFGLLLVFFIVGVPATISLFMMNRSARTSKILIRISIALSLILMMAVITDKPLSGVLDMGPFLLILLLVSLAVKRRQEDPARKTEAEKQKTDHSPFFFPATKSFR
jgi:hypothetical protein